MALTKAQLKKIEEIISRRMLGFTYEAVGSRAFTDSEIANLKSLGLLRSTTRSFIGDPMLLGKIVALIPPSRRVDFSFEELMRMAKKAGPLSAVERKMIQYAEERAGEYIKGIATMTMRDVKAASSSAAMTALRAVQEGVMQTVANRETASELKTRLFDILDDASRDWRRVASTELNNAIQFGVYNEIRETSDEGDDQLVYKLPNPDACKHCKRVYLMPDGITPRVFKLNQLADSNIGLKADSWQPTIGAVHPWCQCQIVVIPEGYNFVTKKVVYEDFEHEGKSYKRGSIISDEAIKETHAEKLMDNAILSYTGKTAKPVEKSLSSSGGDELMKCEC